MPKILQPHKAKDKNKIPSIQQQKLVTSGASLAF